MTSQSYLLKNNRALVIREAAAQDAAEILDYIHTIAGESDHLTFGPGEFDVPLDREREIIDRFHETDNQLYLVGLLDGQIVGTLSFTGGHRPRLRHAGEFGVSVRKAYWGLGIGSLMLEALLDWARDTQIITKVNLRVRTDNVRAIALYLRQGFVLEGTIRREIRIDGTYYDLHWMGLEL